MTFTKTYEIKANEILLIWNDHYETFKIIQILRISSMKKKSSWNEINKQKENNWECFKKHNWYNKNFV